MLQLYWWDIVIALIFCGFIDRIILIELMYCSYFNEIIFVTMYLLHARFSKINFGLYSETNNDITHCSTVK